MTTTYREITRHTDMAWDDEEQVTDNEDLPPWAFWTLMGSALAVVGFLGYVLLQVA